MEVSIIIVNYNTQALTSQCIDSVFDKVSGISFEIILVDNASKDGSKSFFENDSRIKYVYSEENLGFGKANNLGFKYSTGNYVFLLNSDTYLINNAIYLMWKQMEDLRKDEKIENVGCVGCMLRDKDGDITHSYSRFPKMIRTILADSVYPVLWKSHILSKLPSTSNYVKGREGSRWFDVDYITGADLMIRRDVCEKLGMFDPDFFMYSEEVEMQHRYMKAGFRRIINNEAQIVHLVGKSTGTLTPQKRTMIMKSMFLYFKKTSNPVTYHIFNIIYKLFYIPFNIFCFPFFKGSAREKFLHIKNVSIM